MGTPEQIVELFKKYSDWGIDGIALTWLDYHQGIKDFVAGVQPLMEAAGLREPFLSDASPVLNEAREAVENGVIAGPQANAPGGPTPL